MPLGVAYGLRRSRHATQHSPCHPVDEGGSSTNMVELGGAGCTLTGSCTTSSHGPGWGVSSVDGVVYSKEKEGAYA